MNARAAIFLPAILGPLALSLGPGTACAAVPTIVPPSPVTAEAMRQAERHVTYPTFAGIPPKPDDVRSFQAWKGAILAIEGTGHDMDKMAAAEPWTLSDTEGWAAEGRAEATPPPPLTRADDPSTDAIVRAMRERAKQPPRTH